MPYCPQCKSEYREGYSVCKDCGVDLVKEPPEEEFEQSPSWLDHCFKVFAVQVDAWQSTRSIICLSWILVAVTLYYLFHNMVNNTEYSFFSGGWLGSIERIRWFLACSPYAEFLFAILTLMLAGYLLKSHRIILLWILFCISIAFAFLSLGALTDLVIHTIQYYQELLEDSLVIIKITGIAAMLIYTLMAWATAVMVGKSLALERRGRA